MEEAGIVNKVTIYDVAKLANCSAATVSLVLNNSDRIKPSTRAKVLEAVKELGYSPNFAAQCLINQQTNLLGLVLPNVENPLFAQMIKGVEEQAAVHGYNIILGVSELSLEKEIQYMEMLSRRQVDGMLIFPTFPQEIFEQYIKPNDHHIPVVLCGSSGPNEYPVSYVKCDNRMGAFKAVEHLVDIGRQRIAMLCAVADKNQAASRISGYRDALMFSDMPVDEDLIRFCTQDAEDIYQATVALLKEKRPDAIFCLYDYMCISVVRALQNCGCRIPDDVAIVGFDNIHLSQFLPVSLSTIETHSQKVGRMATDLLIKKIQNPKAEIQQIKLNPHLIVRESTMGSEKAPSHINVQAAKNPAFSRG